MDEVGRNKLMQEYMQTGKSEIREQLHCRICTIGQACRRTTQYVSGL